MNHAERKDSGLNGRHGPASFLRALPVLALALALGACFDEPTRPAARPGEEGGNDTRTPPGVLGLVEVTISGIGTGQMTSYAISARNLAELERLRALRDTGAHASGEDGNRALRATEASRESGVPAGAADPQARYAFTLPSNSDDEGDGTIQLELASTGSFTHGERGKGGYRYLYATYRVRNARKDGTPYDTERRNLTLVAVKPSGPSKAIGHTPLSKLLRFDGSDADVGLAEHLIPTGAAIQTRGVDLEARFPDVLQVFTEEEAAEILGLAADAGLAIDDVFPYGFVVSNATDDARELPANPDEDQFDGVVTFAYKVPLQADPADDPFTVRILFLAVDDGETKITQSLEEVTPAGIAAFDARAAALTATELRLLPWGASAFASYERFCSVRSAGPASSPAAYVASAPGNLVSLSPDPYAGSASSIPATTQFAATFDRGVSGLSPREGLIVHGNQSGRRFVRGTFAGHGTPTITTPVATFFPGEEVEVVIAPSIGRSPCADEDFPTVFRYRVATRPSAGIFEEDKRFTYSFRIWAMAVGDVDGDGDLDLVVGEYTSDLNQDKRIFVYRNQGGGTFDDSPSETYFVGRTPAKIALGDLDADGHLDMVVTLYHDNTLLVMRNRGDGTFEQHRVVPTPQLYPYFVSLGDLDGDGDLDLVTNNLYDKRVLVFLNPGDGAFDQYTQYLADDSYGAGNHALADVNGDGYLDLIVALNADNAIELFLNRGDGTFESHAKFPAEGELPIPVAAADLDGDGFPDLVVGHDWSETVAVFFNDGGGGFAMPGAPYELPKDVYTDPWWIVVGDVDGDGDLDIVVTSGFAGQFHVLRNTGHRQFTVEGPFPFGPGHPEVAALGDLDGDGDLDLIVGSSSTNGAVVIYKNR